MNRIYTVKLSHYKSSRTPQYPVVAKSAGEAVAKARRAAVRETGWRTHWVIEELIHLGRAI